jgi:hypothetical protein
MRAVLLAVLAIAPCLALGYPIYRSSMLAASGKPHLGGAD